MSRRSLIRMTAAGAGARLLYRVLVSHPPVSEKTWTRTNHRGDQLTLLEGPAVGGAAAAAALVVPGLDGATRAALALAGTGAGAFGCYDDLAGSGDRRGFRGHLGALARGEVTTGAVKLIGIGATGLAASLLLSTRDRAAGGSDAGGSAGGSSLAGQAADVVINAGLVAGMANLINLFDLRPGRAAKVSLAVSAAIGAAGPEALAAVSAPAGAALALVAEDLGERAMLGDAGANALGAMLGTAAAATLPRPARIGALAVITGLTAASERVSFTKVIERTPALRWLDMLGRRPVPPSAGQKASPDGAVPRVPSPAPEGGAAGAGVRGGVADGDGAAPEDRVPGDVAPGDVTPGDVMPGDVMPGDVMPGDVMPGDVMPGGGVPDPADHVPPPR